jgi:hypothetical protein
MIPMRLSTLLVLFLAVVSSEVEARLGETPIQFADRYGTPKDLSVTKSWDKTFPLIEGAVHHVYEFQGWRIRAAFLQLDAPAIRIDYQKILTGGVDPTVHDYELQAIMGANTPAGMSWKQVSVNNPASPNKGLAKFAEGYFAGAAGQKMWQRTDGAVAWLRSTLQVRLELPAARQYEDQLKAAKEQKARASVPKF